MKEKEFDTGNLIKFKELSDKIKSISDSEFDEDEFDLNEFKESGFSELFSQILTEKLSEPFEFKPEELYEDIVDNFFVLQYLYRLNYLQNFYVLDFAETHSLLFQFFDYVF